MINDEERREVAARLRKTRVERYNSILSGIHLGESVRVCAQIVSPHEDQVRAAADRLADLIEPSCDRDALLGLADEMDRVADENRLTGMMAIGRARAWADRIREALEVER